MPKIAFNFKARDLCVFSEGVKDYMFIVWVWSCTMQQGYLPLGVPGLFCLASSVAWHVQESCPEQHKRKTTSLQPNHLKSKCQLFGI